ncbi:MAG: hypothetical protein J6A69_04055 [Clostridia bacterium]|nr:hypothetical protein [Clostridia bacterium]
MEYVLLCTVILLVAFQNIAKKYYLVKSTKQYNYTLSFVITVVAMIFFVVKAGFRLNFTWDFVPYSLGFALSYGASTAGALFAVKYGSFSVSSLITSYSLIIPTFYGVFVYKDPVEFIGYVGFFLLCVSLFMIREKDKIQSKVSFKWIISILISFAGNGFCSLVQKIQQFNFEGEYKSEFMIVALFICAIGHFVMMIVSKEASLSDLKYSLPIGAMTGLANGVVNYLVMVLTATVPNAILFPSISAGGIVLTFVAGITIYKERFSKAQYMGYILGVTSLILLNL